jgi:uncharacterized protein YndB with AHSA1/START domain
MLTALIDAPREKLFRAWTDPKLIVQWFTPAPWSTVRAEVDLRPGGSSLIVMADENGNEYPNPGIYLEVVENEKLVFTDAYTSAWQPSEKPFFTGVLTFEDEGGKTRYTAHLFHWRAEDREEHEKMGFHEGWAICTRQLAELVARI